MDHEEYNDLLREKDRYILFWDQEPCADAGLADIDEKKLQRFLKIAIRARNLQLNVELPLAEILEKLSLTKKGRITNAAIALFGKQPQRFFNHLEVRAARFKGTDKREFIENKVFDGDLFELLERAEAFLNVYNQISSYIPKDSWQRVDRPEYPYDALREAVINALIHRDYYNRRATNSIAVFDDRIEIWNAGKLPPGYTIDTLKGPHSSVPNNPTIAQMFFLCGRIEKWGRGTQNIIDDCRKHGIPDPEFSENSGGIQVTFRKSATVDKRVDLDGLNKSQRKIIEYLLKHGKGQTGELSEWIGISKAAVRKNISGMSDIIEWVGSSLKDPKGFYRIKR
jgi:ATP-dependent DNA helicase RecG